MNPEITPGRKHPAAASDGSGPGSRALYLMVLTAAVLFPGCTQPAPVETREDGRLPIFHRTGTPIYFADLSRAQPESALTRQEKRFAWRLIDYETAHFKGTLVFAGEEAQAPDLTLGLDTAGVHDVYVGMFNTAWRPYQNMNVRARLSGDPAFSTLFLPAPEGLTSGVPEDDTVRGPRIQEVYFKTADLSGQDLIIRQPCQRVVPPDQEYGNPCEKAWIAYVKLVPLNPEEVANLEQDRKRTDTRRLFGYNDSWAVAWGRAEPASAEFVRSHLEPYRNSDFRRIYWDGIHGDVCNYFTRIGRMWTREHYPLENFVRTGDRLLVESWTEYVEKGIDPLRVAAEAAREMGLEIHVNYRLGWGPFYWPPPWEAFNRGGFWDRHPEWRTVHRDGTPGTAMSLAFPGVRDTMLSFVREMAAYPVDGIAILYNRQPPYVEYEAPLVEGFQGESGKDPRELDEQDPEWRDWLTYRSRAATRFMKDLRRTLEESAREQGRDEPFEITAWVFGSLQENLEFGLDPETWVREGLVDTLIPYSSAKHLFSWQPSWEDPRDVAAWVSLTRGTGTKLALNVMPRNLPVAEYRRKAHALYGAGVEYLAFWDTVIHGSASSLALRRLGHAEEIAAWLRAGQPAEELPFSRLRKLGDWDLSFFPE